MPIYLVSRSSHFPPAELAEPDGLLAVGGDLSVGRLLTAYRHGIFPWYSHGQPILWWSPDPRMVLFPDELHVPKSLQKTMRKQPFTITWNQDFPQVIHHCGLVRQEQGTWITSDMEDAYIQLHRKGYAHSAEAWEGDPPRLVGGLYGVQVGRVFSGESMFHLSPDASKIAFVMTVLKLRVLGFELIDCQMYTDHLARFGSREISRADYLHILNQGLRTPFQPSPQEWRRPITSF
ncbi:MAG: leucyl/phenylalanyl-tRNA--protein transferase [Magnetococcales bacterium]|nr:leucyl/phenylalanyl-tRNA--protein transferase [Magnetococcales bacterium]NGZ25439.1 leucyl/phenylalanyl-tRNA--protein transferase [Magnetococcales bacterium]